MAVKRRVRSWLVFSRSHTAILEAPIAALGAALALSSFWNIEVLKWTVFGFLYHVVGYSMNSYADWKNGFDKDDPNKKHHPLNTGDISPKAAEYFVKGSTVLLLVYALILTNFKTEALVILCIMVLSGVSYNYFGKITQHKYIMLSVAHTSVFLLAYMSYDGSYSNIIWIGALAYFIHHVFQILISGDVKDVEMDESSLVQDLGMEIDYLNGRKLLDVDPSVIVISYIIAILEGVIVIGILLFFDPANYIIALTIILFAWMVMEVDDVVSEGIYNRSSRVAAMSRKELAGLWMIFASFTSAIGIKAFIGMVVLSLAYFIPISYLMWGGLKPDV